MCAMRVYCFTLSSLFIFCIIFVFFFFFKQKTAYEMRISDWSSDVCSSDLACHLLILSSGWESLDSTYHLGAASPLISLSIFLIRVSSLNHLNKRPHNPIDSLFGILQTKKRHRKLNESCIRSKEHTSELQSLMRISYAVFCLKKNTQTNIIIYDSTSYEK